MSPTQSNGSPVVGPSVDSSESTKFQQLSIDILDEDHRELFTRAVTRILSTDIAEITYAQIIDGLPLFDVLLDSRDGLFPKGHPIRNHTQLCPGILDKTREFRDKFRPQILQFDSRVRVTHIITVPKP